MLENQNTTRRGVLTTCATAIGSTALSDLSFGATPRQQSATDPHLSFQCVTWSDSLPQKFRHNQQEVDFRPISESRCNERRLISRLKEEIPRTFKTQSEEWYGTYGKSEEFNHSVRVTVILTHSHFGGITTFGPEDGGRPLIDLMLIGSEDEIMTHILNHEAHHAMILNRFGADRAFPDMALELPAFIQEAPEEQGDSKLKAQRLALIKEEPMSFNHAAKFDLKAGYPQAEQNSFYSASYWASSALLRRHFTRADAKRGIGEFLDTLNENCLKNQGQDQCQLDATLQQCYDTSLLQLQDQAFYLWRSFCDGKIKG